MTHAQAKSELMQIYMSLSEEKKQALDVLMAQADGDLISRTELLKAIDTWDKFGCDADTKLVPYQDHYIPYIHYDDVIKCIKGMPPVKPQEPKTGHWITKIKSDLRGDMWPTNPKCSKCGGEPYYSNTIYDYKFCPYCGARMVEERERSDKE